MPTSPEGFPDPLHALWVTGGADGADASPSSPSDALVTTLAEVGVSGSCLRLSGEPLSPGRTETVGQTGTFVKRVFETSPALRDDATLDGSYLLSTQLYVPDPAQQEDCRRWLDQEHSGRQLAVPGTLWFAGYESQDGDFNFLNLWGLESPEVIETPEWVEARETPWRDRLLESAIVRTERSLFRWGRAERMRFQ